jgi:c-di-GMP-binding flagellar brake protein YcgR
MPAGTAITLHFDLGDLAITASGVIALSFFDGGRQRFLHGVAFSAIDPAHQEAIVRHVTEHAKKS